MNIISIDQSLTHCAIIIYIIDRDKLEYFNVIKTDKFNGTIEQRIILILNEINFYIKKYNIQYAILESLPYNCVSSSVRPLAGLFYSLLVNFVNNNIKYEHYSPTEIKKIATGKGTADKLEMINALPLDILEEFSKKYKKTSGLADLADAFHIINTYKSKNINVQ